MISAITNRGEISFQIVEGTINTERFIEFLERLLQEAPDNKVWRTLRCCVAIERGVRLKLGRCIACLGSE